MEGTKQRARHSYIAIREERKRGSKREEVKGWGIKREKEERKTPNRRKRKEAKIKNKALRREETETARNTQSLYLARNAHTKAINMSEKARSNHTWPTFPNDGYPVPSPSPPHDPHLVATPTMPTYRPSGHLISHCPIPSLSNSLRDCSNTGLDREDQPV